MSEVGCTPREQSLMEIELGRIEEALAFMAGQVQRLEHRRVALVGPMPEAAGKTEEGKGSGHLGEFARMNGMLNRLNGRLQEEVSQLEGLVG